MHEQSMIKNALTCETMHEHVEILPKYMGHSPIKKHKQKHKHKQTQWDITQSRKTKDFAREEVFPNLLEKITQP